MQTLCWTLQLKPEGLHVQGHVALTGETCPMMYAHAQPPLVGCLAQCWSSSELAPLQRQDNKSSIVFDTTTVQGGLLCCILAAGLQVMR